MLTVFKTEQEENRTIVIKDLLNFTEEYSTLRKCLSCPIYEIISWCWQNSLPPSGLTWANILTSLLLSHSAIIWRLSCSSLFSGFNLEWKLCRSIWLIFFPLSSLFPSTVDKTTHMLTILCASHSLCGPPRCCDLFLVSFRVLSSQQHPDLVAGSEEFSYIMFCRFLWYFHLVSHSNHSEQETFLVVPPPSVLNPFHKIQITFVLHAVMSS